jgi:uncharacterized membrane protein
MTPIFPSSFFERNFTTTHTSTRQAGYLFDILTVVNICIFFYVQVVPVKGYVMLPQFEVSLSTVAFDTVLVGETCSSTFQLINPSLSDTLWTITQGIHAIWIGEYCTSPLLYIIL